MYSTSELDELFQILNSVKGFKLNNHKGATQHFMWTWHDATLALCIYSIEILMVGSVPFMKRLILLDLALNAALQRTGSRAKWSMAV